MAAENQEKVRKILGIDESGRGPVIGPLVMCGFMLSEDKLGRLKEMGVKDSKLLTPQRRSTLYQKLKELADDWAPIKLTAMDIDKLRSESNLNKIEIRHMQELINTMKPDIAIIDAIEANTAKFRATVLAGLKPELKEREKSGEFELICKNFADRDYPIVGAASIMAKVIRDAEVRKLAKEHGSFGSGYSSDPRTMKFLKDWLAKHKEFPHFVRRSWVTAKELKKDHDQKGIQVFVKKELEEHH
jgi:ribonuclease HII